MIEHVCASNLEQIANICGDGSDHKPCIVKVD